MKRSFFYFRKKNQMDKNEEILKKIHSNDPEQINEAIQTIKENGDLTIASALLGQLGQLSNSHTTTLLVNLLADIKENNFREVLIQQLKETEEPAIQCHLLRIIWESSLDYSAYLDLFLQFLSQPDFTVAFEASTVIENMIHHLDNIQKEKLHQCISAFPEDKLFLVENIHEEMHHCQEEEEEN